MAEAAAPDPALAGRWVHLWPVEDHAGDPDLTQVRDPSTWNLQAPCKRCDVAVVRIEERA